jgi:hypothetical protein
MQYRRVGIIIMENDKNPIAALFRGGHRTVGQCNNLRMRRNITDIADKKIIQNV